MLAVTLPGIDEEVKEIWRNLRESSNVITRRDLIRISCILSRCAESVEDGLFVEHDCWVLIPISKFNVFKMKFVTPKCKQLSLNVL